MPRQPRAVASGKRSGMRANSAASRAAIPCDGCYSCGKRKGKAATGSRAMGHKPTLRADMRPSTKVQMVYLKLRRWQLDMPKS
jgi:hypothetical protein